MYHYLLIGPIAMVAGVYSLFLSHRLVLGIGAGSISDRHLAGRQYPIDPSDVI